MKDKILFEKKVSGSIGESYWFGIHYGAIYGKIIVFKDKIIIKYLGLKIILKKRDIKYFKKYQGFFGFLSRGIRIHHNRKDIPPFIAIWNFPKDRDRLFNELKKIGYRVK